jgi:ABC-type glycerol-3-phosphate transport system permease component
MQFRGRQVLFTIVVGLLVVPLQMTFVPVFAAFISMILPLIVCFSAQQYSARGILAGSVKE